MSQCPTCRDEIEHSEAIWCPKCAVPHHDDCWHYNGGCAIYGCATTDNCSDNELVKRILKEIEAKNFHTAGRLLQKIQDYGLFSDVSWTVMKASLRHDKEERIYKPDWAFVGVMSFLMIGILVVTIIWYIVS